jgi:hypothetical protein
MDIATRRRPWTEIAAEYVRRLNLRTSDRRGRRHPESCRRPGLVHGGGVLLRTGDHVGGGYRDAVR